MLVLLLGCTFFIPSIVSADATQYVYDSLNRLIEVHYPDKTIFYTYDAAGNRTSVQIVYVGNVPTISGLSPDNAGVGGGAFTLTVNGANFVNGATVQWNGLSRTTSFTSSTQVQANIPAADIAVSGSTSVAVTNPAPAGGTSNALSFTIGNATTPALSIDSVAPRTGHAPGGQQLTLTGTFTNLSTVMIGGIAANINSNSGSQVVVTTPVHAVGAVDIVLTPTSGSTYTKSNAFAYLPTTFTDDTLVVGVTTAKAQHITELRQAVDALRAVAGLPAAQWTDPVLLGTFIKAVHITELRTALEQAAQPLGYPSFQYTDPALGAGGTIKRVHIEELRQRIRSIAG